MKIDYFYEFIMESFLKNIDLNTFDFSQLIRESISIYINYDNIDKNISIILKLLCNRFEVWKFLLNFEQKKYLTETIIIFINICHKFKIDYAIKIIAMDGASIFDLLCFIKKYNIHNEILTLNNKIIIKTILNYIYDNRINFYQDTMHSKILKMELRFVFNNYPELRKFQDKVLNIILNNCYISINNKNWKIQKYFNHNFKIISNYIEYEYWDCLKIKYLEFFINDDINKFIEYIQFEKSKFLKTINYYRLTLKYKSIKIFKYLLLTNCNKYIINNICLNYLWDNEMFRLIQQTKNSFKNHLLFKSSELNYIIKSNNYELLRYLIDNSICEYYSSKLLYVPYLFDDKDITIDDIKNIHNELYVTKIDNNICLFNSNKLDKIIYEQFLYLLEILKYKYTINSYKYNVDI